MLSKRRPSSIKKSDVPINNKKGFAAWIKGETIEKESGGQTAEQLGAKLGVAAVTIRKWWLEKTKTLGFAYVENIARYLGGQWTARDVEAWLSAEDGTKISEFKESHDFSLLEEEAFAVGLKVEQIADTIRTVRSTTGLSPVQQIYLIQETIGAIEAPLQEESPELDLPQEWTETLDLVPDGLINVLRSMPSSFPDWSEIIDAVFDRQMLPTPSIVNLIHTLMIMNGLNPPYQQEEITLALGFDRPPPTESGSASNRRQENS